MTLNPFKAARDWVFAEYYLVVQRAEKRLAMVHDRLFEAEAKLRSVIARIKALEDKIEEQFKIGVLKK